MRATRIGPVVAEITLIEHSTAGNPPKVFRAQTVSIVHELSTVMESSEGEFVPGHHPSTVMWFGGNVHELDDITDVKIVAANGEVLIEGELNRFHGGPHEVDGGVGFYVLRPE
jgi:hypothetical protein